MATAPLLILECDPLETSAPELHAARGGMGAFFRDALGPEPTLVRRAWRREALPPVETVSGVLVTGAAAMVADPDPWIGETRSWLRTAAAAGAPMLGVCFGHQLLADMLGGTVAATPDGPEVGTVAVELAAAGQDDPLTAALPARFAAQASHFQSVVTPPPGAVVLARNALAVQALRFAPRIWGVQFHPEFAPGDLAAIIRWNAQPLARAHLDPARAIQGLKPTPEAASILGRFAILARETAGR
ncbi:glutamine amidotransferase [Phenylobacterium sp. LjRoot225]|uniref:glutamine amidotransferase n=1 Tax=Phenylobacterium sp. LjRoot225 TaxID=3342285 RepID=UPI003ECC84B2